MHPSYIAQWEWPFLFCLFVVFFVKSNVYFQYTNLAGPLTRKKTKQTIVDGCPATFYS